MKICTYVMVMALIMSILSSCSDRPDYKLHNSEIIASGLRQLRWPARIERLFGQTDHFVDFSGHAGSKQWNTVAYFDGRYELTLQVEVEIGANYSIQNSKSPKLSLVEVESLERRENGTFQAKISNQWVLDESQIDRLLESNGAWETVGIAIKKGQPLRDFDEYVKQWRTPRK
jgi:hypothetical protein